MKLSYKRLFRKNKPFVIACVLLLIIIGLLAVLLIQKSISLEEARSNYAGAQDKISSMQSKTDYTQKQIDDLSSKLQESKDKYDELKHAALEVEPYNSQVNTAIRNQCGTDTSKLSFDELTKQFSLPADQQSQEYKARQQWLNCATNIVNTALDLFIADHH